MMKKFVTRLGLTAGVAALALGGVSGTAQATPGAAYVGPGYPNNPHAVWCVQHLMNDVSRQYGQPTVDEDGVWGPKTFAAVKTFQNRFWATSSNGADGIVGPTTGEYLLSYGDSYYGRGNYCFWYLPSPDATFMPVAGTRLD
ncbi:peptidoglycan-binding protein [Kitasatospora indigofera]|uniref:peptidoglycan-binding domain-containing protein n=1 Tax=Kitasatospora indigofera TaxID=67307 RepID=UPI0036C386A9